MRYVYDVFVAEHNKPDKRIDTSTQLSEAEGIVKNLRTDWVIVVSDTLKRVQNQYLRSQDDIDTWYDTIGRSVWQDKETKEKIKQQLAERTAMGWKPFDEAETEIHMKDGGVVRDTVAPDDIRVVLSKGESALPTDIDSNIKTRAAIGKPKMSGVPPVAFFALGSAMQDGVRKYGRFNWRSTEVTASVFYDAIERHVLAWYSGEEHASDSGVHHLAHVMACCAIILDAKMHGVFTDDRQQSTLVPEKKYWMKPDANTG